MGSGIREGHYNPIPFSFKTNLALHADSSLVRIFAERSTDCHWYRNTWERLPATRQWPLDLPLADHYLAGLVFVGDAPQYSVSTSELSTGSPRTTNPTSGYDVSYSGPLGSGALAYWLPCLASLSR